MNNAMTLLSALRRPRYAETATNDVGGTVKLGARYSEEVRPLYVKVYPLFSVVLPLILPLSVKYAP